MFNNKTGLRALFLEENGYIKVETKISETEKAKETKHTYSLTKKGERIYGNIKSAFNIK